MNAPSHDYQTESRRRSQRLDLRCRARIRIGKREYAGYVENISKGGARIRTLSPIRGTGSVCLIIPDMPPLRGHIRWVGPQESGICFSMSVHDSTLEKWARSRLLDTYAIAKEVPRQSE